MNTTAVFGVLTASAPTLIGTAASDPYTILRKLGSRIFKQSKKLFEEGSETEVSLAGFGKYHIFYLMQTDQGQRALARATEKVIMTADHKKQIHRDIICEHGVHGIYLRNRILKIDEESEIPTRWRGSSFAIPHQFTGYGTPDQSTGYGST